MSHLFVQHSAGDRFEIAVRGHRVPVDQPMDVGGDDTAPTPTELFVAALASCVAFYGRRFLARHGLAENLRVEATYELSHGSPTRVEEIVLSVHTEAVVPPARMTAFQRVLEHCTVHNSMREPPQVRIALDRGRTAA